MNNREQQLHFKFKRLKKKKPRIKHGGEEHANRHKRKEERPFEPAKHLHVTMRASSAVGENSMLHPSRSRKVRHIVFRAAKRHGIVLTQFVCVGNHLHLLIRTQSRHAERARLDLHAFLRESAGLIARLMTGAKRGRPARRPLSSVSGCQAVGQPQTFEKALPRGQPVKSIETSRAAGSSEKARPCRRAFWDYLAWSRIVEWGRDLVGIKKYLQKNFQEFICVLAEYHWPSPELADYG